MSAVVLTLLAPFVLGLFAAAVNYWVWRQRRAERGHLALAIAGLASAAPLVAAGMAYASETRVGGIAAHLGVFLCTVPMFLTLAWLAENVYGQRMRAHWLIGPAISIAWVIAGLVPGALFGDGTVVRGTGPLGITYVDVELTRLGQIAPLTYLPGVLWFTWTTTRFARAGVRGVVIASSLASGAAGCFDYFVAGGWIDAPYVFGIVFSATSIVFTALLLRRFIETLARVEASADLLQRAAEARARELRESDLQLAQGARLAALGTLAAGLAHEINNPVAFVRANLNYLAELPASERDDPELDEVLSETEEGVARLRGIVTELLRLSQHGSAGFAEVKLNDVVESALPTLRFEARDDVAIEAHLPGLPPVRGDRNLLGQVVANLVLNAIQALRASGAPGVVRISTFSDGERAVLEVADSGPGVPAEVAQRIFEPFFTTKPPGQGTGLGLAVSRQLVERHGGRLTLAPSQRGARFQVELPFAQA